MQMPVQRLSPSAQQDVKRPMRPPNRGRRIRREKRTITAMVGIYCRDHHDCDSAELCSECSALLRYAHQRLNNCVFGELKQPCSHCSVHCYSKQQRPRITEVMRYAGPRMTLRYPLLSVFHLIDKLRAR